MKISLEQIANSVQTAGQKVGVAVRNVGHKAVVTALAGYASLVVGYAPLVVGCGDEITNVYNNGENSGDSSPEELCDHFFNYCCVYQLANNETTQECREDEIGGDGTMSSCIEFYTGKWTPSEIRCIVDNQICDKHEASDRCRE